MTDETAEKLAGLLDQYAVTGDEQLLAEYLRGSHAELAGRLEHLDMMQHALASGIGGVAAGVAALLAELEAFRPLLNMFKPNGSRQPDWISAAQTIRTARREAASNGGDQRAGTPRGSRARRGTPGRQLPDA